MYILKVIEINYGSPFINYVSYPEVYEISFNNYNDLDAFVKDNSLVNYEIHSVS